MNPETTVSMDMGAMPILLVLSYIRLSKHKLYPGVFDS